MHKADVSLNVMNGDLMRDLVCSWNFSTISFAVHWSSAMLIDNLEPKLHNLLCPSLVLSYCLLVPYVWLHRLFSSGNHLDSISRRLSRSIQWDRPCGKPNCELSSRLDILVNFTCSTQSKSINLCPSNEGSILDPRSSITFGTLDNSHILISF